MAVARLEQAKTLSRLKAIVAMNDFDIVRFGEENKYSLATKDLNSCHAVVIVSRKAAILAHIAPNSPDSVRNQYPTSMAWITYKINQVVQCFTTNKGYFENQGPGGIVVYGIFNNEVALPDQLKLIAATVQNKMQLAVKGASYKILEKQDSRGQNKGVVLIEGVAIGQLPLIWVEDRQVPVPQAASARTASTTTASSSK